MAFFLVHLPGNTARDKEAFYDHASISSPRPGRGLLSLWLPRPSGGGSGRSDRRDWPLHRCCRQDRNAHPLRDRHHLHADHISSGRDLAKATGAEYVLFADAAVTFPFPRRPAMAKFSSWAMSLSRSCIHRGIRPSTFHLSSPIGPVQTNHVSC